MGGRRLREALASAKVAAWRCWVRGLSCPYKWAPGRVLSVGLHVNRFGYIPGEWPARTPVRAYIRDFLVRHVHLVQEPCAEFNPPYYRPLVLATGRVQPGNYDVIDLTPGPGVTVVG